MSNVRFSSLSACRDHKGVPWNRRYDLINSNGAIRLNARQVHPGSRPQSKNLSHPRIALRSPRQWSQNATAMRILIIEDDRMIGESLRRGLQDEGYAVNWVRDGNSAVTALRDKSAEYAAVLLDWGLPHGDGLGVLKAIRTRGNHVPVVMVTARDSVEDRITGLDAGADDYLVKPFELSELKARIRSVVRRAAGRAESGMAYGRLVLDPASHRVMQDGQEVNLTAREFALLRAMLEHPGSVLSRTQLEERLYSWNEPVESNVVEVLIHSVRKKLGAETIENVRGIGWRLVP